MVRAVFPGTFDPIHYGHIDIAERASRIFDELIIAVYDKPLKNLLFSPDDRLEMVHHVFDNHSNIKVTGYSGLTIEFCRKINASVIVRGLRVFSDFEHEFRMAHANHRLAPEVEVIALITSDQQTFLSSTTVKEIASLGGNVESMVPGIVMEAFKKKFRELGEGQQVVPITSLRD
jgi:pantetheine-phosphate adenylyltransferase